jgi:hypothetical protein
VVGALDGRDVGWPVGCPVGCPVGSVVGDPGHGVECMVVGI